MCRPLQSLRNKGLMFRGNASAPAPDMLTVSYPCDLLLIICFSYLMVAICAGPTLVSVYEFRASLKSHDLVNRLSMGLKRNRKFPKRIGAIIIIGTMAISVYSPVAVQRCEGI